MFRRCSGCFTVALALGMLMAPGLAGAATLRSNPELTRLAAADQADRTQPHAHGQRIDWNVVDRRDAARRAKVLELLGSGQIHSAEDFSEAALIFQHGPSAKDTRLALAFATLAVKLDELHAKPHAAAARLMAEAWDRTLERHGQPQWYGTQYVRSRVGGKWHLYHVDPTAVTDRQREQMGLPTLAEAAAYAEQLNQRTAKLHPGAARRQNIKR